MDAGDESERTGDPFTARSTDRARSSSWGGPVVRAELRRLAADAARRAGFRVCAIEVLRSDGLLELVALTGGPPSVGGPVGSSFDLRHVRRVLDAGTRFGTFVFLGEEEMSEDLKEVIRGYGYLPAVPDSTDPRRWRTLDMLVAPVADSSGRTRALLHLDEPLSGRRPRPAELHDVAAQLELTLESVLAVVEREELSRRARLDETARATVRAASQRLGHRELLAQVHEELVAGFGARSLAVQLYDEPEEPEAAGSAAVVPAHLRPAIEAATRRAWQSRTVVIAEPGRVWGDDRLDREHEPDLTAHLVAHAASELLLVPVGAGHEPMGMLVVVRDEQADRWTEGESQAALGVGHDLGRALLSTRAHEREQQLIDELQQLDEYRKQFLATISHELKNPLGLIIGHVEMLETVPGLPPEATRSLAALGRGASRLAALVDDLLLLSRISHVDRPVAQQPVDLGGVVRTVAEEESLRAQQQGVAIRIAPLDGTLRVLGDREELHRMVTNLVSNAVKYSSAGGAVDLSLEVRGEQVVFTCADQGLGISEGDREHLFTEFFRTTNREALRRPGTGLGLAIARRIVERHSGRVEVETELGVGTTMRVTLPRAT